MVSLKRYKLILDRDTNEDYLHRYYLFIKDRVKFPINLTLHLIVKSDSPIFHDHPWAFGTLILKGGYWEHVPKWNAEHTAYEDVRVWKGPGSIICRKADDLHWLELEENKPATTLFFMGPQKREWGFLVTKVQGNPRWIQWQEYLNNWNYYHNKYVIKKAA